MKNFLKLSAIFFMSACAYTPPHAQTHATQATQAKQATQAYVEAPDPSRDPKGADIHMAYEWSTFTPTKPEAHAPGAVLSGPGDNYRYTILREDKYANNPNYKIVRAIVGFHIDDVNPKAPKQKWGRIEINNKPRPFKIMFEPDTRTSTSSHLVQIISDATLSGTPGSSLPPYVYDVTDIMSKGENVVVEITNLRKDGTIDSSAPFNGFIINRIGAHVWYAKNE